MKKRKKQNKTNSIGSMFLRSFCHVLMLITACKNQYLHYNVTFLDLKQCHHCAITIQRRLIPKSIKRIDFGINLLVQGQFDLITKLWTNILFWPLNILSDSWRLSLNISGWVYFNFKSQNELVAPYTLGKLIHEVCKHKYLDQAGEDAIKIPQHFIQLFEMAKCIKQTVK